MITISTVRYPSDMAVQALSVIQLAWLKQYCNDTHLVIEMDRIFDPQTFMYKSTVYISFENTGDETAFKLKFGNIV